MYIASQEYHMTLLYFNTPDYNKEMLGMEER